MKQSRSMVHLNQLHVLTQNYQYCKYGWEQLRGRSLHRSMHNVEAGDLHPPTCKGKSGKGKSKACE